ncbi:acyl-CoA-binding protein [Mycotypha africana]|uniref:acyl-CoA-binding protein n=1 Tax=Mycotypha africana TaxID=64632 RepID=UPI002301AE6E|nr:acyl-CoA-binding protein [Mycotypha africana]KAI8987965.1 acyl-CoA-binding protein [Mycotypha africana]
MASNMDDICQDDQWFEQAFTYMNEHDVPLSNDKKLLFYGLFKQATIGDVNIEKPGLFEFVARAKYDAWEQFKGLSLREARNRYIEAVENLKVGWSRKGEYEYIPSPDDLEKEGFGNSVSSMAEEESEETDDIFGYARTNNLEALIKAIEANPGLLHSKEEGLNALHIAADRGYSDMVAKLIELGADIDMKTDDGDTALHLACISDKADVAKLLISKGCDQTLLDSEGSTALEQADTSLRQQLETL